MGECEEQGIASESLATSLLSVEADGLCRSKLFRRFISQIAVRTLFVVLLPPRRDDVYRRCIRTELYRAGHRDRKVGISIAIRQAAATVLLNRSRFRTLGGVRSVLRAPQLSTTQVRDVNTVLVVVAFLRGRVRTAASQNSQATHLLLKEQCASLSKASIVVLGVRTTTYPLAHKYGKQPFGLRYPLY